MMLVIFVPGLIDIVLVASAALPVIVFMSILMLTLGIPGIPGIPDMLGIGTSDGNPDIVGIGIPGGIDMVAAGPSPGRGADGRAGRGLPLNAPTTKLVDSIM